MPRQHINGQASKFLVTVLTTVAAALPIYYGTAKWEPVAVMALGAVLTYLVPNTPPDPAAAPPASVTPPP